MSQSPKLRIFLSSTFSDLERERRAVIEVINRMQEVCVAMEYFGSFAAPPVQKSMEYVSKAQVFVLVLANRYGFVPKGQAQSITELEYRRARELALPMLCYLAGKNGGQTGDDDLRLTALKDEVRTSHGVSWFSSEDQLASNIAADLYREARQLLSDELSLEEDGLLARKHEKVVDTLMARKFDEARCLNEAIFAEHSGRSPRANYNQACALSMLAESCEDPERRSELLAKARDHFVRSLEQGIVRLIRLFHDDPSRPTERILNNRGLKCLFDEVPGLRKVLRDVRTEGRVKLGGGCVDGRMPIELLGGDHKPISQVQRGDVIRGWDAERRMTVPSRVVSRRRAIASRELRINDRLVVTDEHPILTTEGWRRAVDLRPRMRMQTTDGNNEVIQRIERLERRALVMDIAVLPAQTFSVAGVVVHNKAAHDRQSPTGPGPRRPLAPERDVTGIVRQIVIEITGANPEDVTEEADLNELGADSLDVVEITMEIEHEFLLPEGVFDESVDIYNVSVRDLLQAVRNHLAGHTPHVPPN